MKNPTHIALYIFKKTDNFDQFYPLFQKKFLHYSLNALKIHESDLQKSLNKQNQKQLPEIDKRSLPNKQVAKEIAKIINNRATIIRQVRVHEISLNHSSHVNRNKGEIMKYSSVISFYQRSVFMYIIT